MSKWRFTKYNFEPEQYNSEGGEFEIHKDTPEQVTNRPLNQPTVFKDLHSMITQEGTRRGDASGKVERGTRPS
jgi:hypothetical protein